MGRQRKDKSAFAPFVCKRMDFVYVRNRKPKERERREERKKRKKEGRERKKV